jgi:hypothetical protein
VPPAVAGWLQVRFNLLGLVADRRQVLEQQIAALTADRDFAGALEGTAPAEQLHLQARNKKLQAKLRPCLMQQLSLLPLSSAPFAGIAAAQPAGAAGR